MGVDYTVKAVVILVGVAIVSFLVAYAVIPERSVVEERRNAQMEQSAVREPELRPEPDAQTPEPAVRIPAEAVSIPTAPTAQIAAARPTAPPTATERAPVDTVAQTPPPAPRPARRGDLRIERAAVSGAIVDRTPQGVSDRFSKDQRAVYYFTHIVGVRDTAAIIHRWYHEGKLIQTSILPIRSTNWRTFSRRNLANMDEKTGNWRVEAVEQGTGRVIESATFVIE